MPVKCFCKINFFARALGLTACMQDILLLAHALGLKAAARPSARVTVGYFVCNLKASCATIGYLLYTLKFNITILKLKVIS